jgi:hypothetical protein
MTSEINPKERYEAAIYTERGGCVAMAFLETPREADNWLTAQLAKIRVEYPSFQRAWQVRDRQENRVLNTDGPAYLIKRERSVISMSDRPQHL